jgi:hypothetical protein
VSGNRKPSIDVVAACLPSVRVNQSAETPSLIGSAAAAWKSASGIFVASAMRARVFGTDRPSRIWKTLVSLFFGSMRTANTAAAGLCTFTL